MSRLVLTFRGPPIFFPTYRGSSGGKFERILPSQTRDPLIVKFRLVLIFRGPPKNCIFVGFFCFVAIKGSFESKERRPPFKIIEGDIFKVYIFKEWVHLPKHINLLLLDNASQCNSFGSWFL